MKNTYSLITCTTDSSPHSNHGLPSAAVGVVVLFTRLAVRVLRNRNHYNALRHSDGRMPRLHPECLTAEVLDLAGVSRALTSSVSSHMSIRPLNIVSAVRSGDRLNLGHGPRGFTVVITSTTRNKNGKLFPYYLRVRPLLHCLSHAAACGVFPIDVERST